MKNITIKSTHSTLEAAIEAAGGLNREFNARLFDKRIEETKKNAARDTFYVIEYNHRDIVLYHYSADIELINQFSPFSACLSSGMTIGWKSRRSFNCLGSIDNNKANRKQISKLQKEGSSIFVLNF